MFSEPLIALAATEHYCVGLLPSCIEVRGLRMIGFGWVMCLHGSCLLHALAKQALPSSMPMLHFQASPLCSKSSVLSHAHPRSGCDMRTRTGA